MPAREAFAKMEAVETFWLKCGPLPPNDWARATAATLAEQDEEEAEAKAAALVAAREGNGAGAVVGVGAGGGAGGKQRAGKVGFVVTASVRANLRSLARAVAAAKYPILLQGPTSSGKTTLVEYLAARLGYHCVRVNNHEHTDIQEYTGSYAADGNGKLAFQEVSKTGALPLAV